MHTLQKLTAYLITLLSLSTATGLVVHETAIDKLPSVHDASYGELGATNLLPEVMRSGHAHAEYNPSQSLINGFTRADPTAPPREQLARKYLMQRYEPRGRHAFDNYCLPVIS